MSDYTTTTNLLVETHKKAEKPHTHTRTHTWTRTALLPVYKPLFLGRLKNKNTIIDELEKDSQLLT